MNFIEKLSARAEAVNSWLCIGLDPVLDKLPSFLLTEQQPLFVFSKEIIRATQDLANAYKINLAFFEYAGIKGWRALAEILKEIPSGAIIIADGKRGDIGNSSKYYAKSLFEEWGFDAQTVNPYLGMDAIQPFIDHPEKGVFVLCLTSNPGATDFQRQFVGAEPLFCRVARKVVEANTNSNCGLVIGATQAEDFPALRKLAPSLPFLIPGIGAQGGDLETSILHGTDRHGNLALINSSRSIIFASGNKDFAERARDAALSLRDQINELRKKKTG